MNDGVEPVFGHHQGQVTNHQEHIALIMTPEMHHRLQSKKDNDERVEHHKIPNDNRPLDQVVCLVIVSHASKTQSQNDAWL